MKTISKAAVGLLASVIPSAPAFAAADISAEIDLLEMHVGSGDDHFVFDSTFEAGPAVLKVEGGSDVGPQIDDVTGQLLYAVPLGEATRLMVGARHDFRGGGDLSYGVFAIEFALTSWLEAEHYLFLSEDGDVTGSGQLTAAAELADGWTLEPRAGFGWSAQDIAPEETGAGFSDIELSVRLRRQLTPALNAYVGGIHERLVGGTRDIARANGDKTSVNRAVIGVGLEF